MLVFINNNLFSWPCQKKKMLLFLIESFVFYFFLLIILFYDAVITFSDAPLALNYVRENKGCVDVILIEVHMPNMDGFQFLHRVGKEINVPVISM